MQENNFVWYFDFEASTNGTKHVPYCVCLSNSTGSISKSFYGKGCSRKLLDFLPNHSLAYAHNLTYDINFIIDLLDAVYEKSIIKGTKYYMIQGIYKSKTLTFKDTYCMIPKPLKLFPTMFKLDSGRKECFPYDYYQSFVQRVKFFDEDKLEMVEGNIFTVPQEIGIIEEALKYIPSEEHEIFKDNIKHVAFINDSEFSMKRYAIFYCMQDVRILKEGFETFRKLLMEQFNLDAYRFVSISSIANRILKDKVYAPNGNIYELANKPRDFISRCIIGGRCMLSDNTKSYINGKIVDFDAVSLYPSAISRLYVLEGLPKVLTREMCNQDYLLEHLFTDEQIEPNSERYISGFFIQAEIYEVGNPLHFPLIVHTESKARSPPGKGERSSNGLTMMYMDHITFEDLTRFQKCKMNIIRGYYYDSKRDITCRDVIKELFELRAKYKKEDNPLQEVIKLLLNSMYGKSILKPIDTITKFINAKDRDRYVHNRFHRIQEMIGYDGGRKIMVKEWKPYSKHFTLCTFGVNVLSMSKRIMCEVMCKMESLGLDIFYTDTDSFFTYKENLDIISQRFSEEYNRPLIGTSLGQFHPDLERINGLDSIGTEAIFVMKKCYIVQLENEKGDVAFHVRLKGIPLDVIVNRANELCEGIKCYDKDNLVYPYSTGEKYTIMELYKKLYEGETIEFDLVKGAKPRFDITIGEIKTKPSFPRRIKLET